MFDFLRDNSKENEVEEVQIDEFEDWFSEKMGGENEIPEIGGVYKNINKTLEEIRKDLDELENSEIPDEVVPRLKKAGSSNKEVLVNRFNGFLNNFQLPKNEDPKTAIEFIQDKSEELDNLSEKLQKNFLFLQKVQEEESRSLLNSIKALEKDLKVPEKVKRAGKIQQKYLEIKNLLDNINSLEGELKEKEEQLENEAEGRKNIEGKLEDLKESKELEKVEKIEKEIESIKGNKQDIENKIIQNISTLKRGMKKLDYSGVVSNGNGDSLKKYIRSPLKAVKTDENLDFLEKILNELEENIGKGNLNFSEKERTKAKRDLNKVNLERLEKWKEKHKESKKRIQKLRSKKKNLKIDEEEGKIKSELEKKEKNIKKIEERVDKKTKEKEEAEKSLNKKVRELEKKIQELFGINLTFKLE